MPKILPLIAVAAVMAGTTAAHEVKLADGRAVDYTGVTGVGGRSCCGSKDCRPVASHWLLDGRLAVQTDTDVWVPVPPEVMTYMIPEVLRDTSDVTHACWRGPAERPLFYCVFPAAQSS